MSKESYYSLADWAVNFAIGEGCQQARAELNYTDIFNLQTLDNEVSTLQQSTSIELTLRLFVDERYGNFSTNRLDKDEIASFIRQGIATTRLLGADKHRTLPDPTRYYSNNATSQMPDLGNYDANCATFSLDEKIRLTRDLAKELQHCEPPIIHLQGYLSDRAGWQYMVDSQGFKGISNASYCHLSASVSLRGEGESRPSEDYYELAIGYDELLKKHKGLARKAYERGVLKLQQAPISSRHYTIAVEPRNVLRLLDPMLDALNGNNLYQQRSFLRDKLHQNITSPLFTLRDEPQRHGAFGACHFDYEGVATHETEIISQGVLRTFFLDTYQAGRLQESPTMSAPSVLVVEPGERSLAQITASSEELLVITGFIGGNHNETTGDFSFGIEGLLYRNGKLIQSVAGMNITGNMLELWQNLIEVGNENEKTGEGQLSSLVFKQVMCNGEQEE